MNAIVHLKPTILDSPTYEKPLYVKHGWTAEAPPTPLALTSGSVWRHQASTAKAKASKWFGVGDLGDANKELYTCIVYVLYIYTVYIHMYNIILVKLYGNMDIETVG